MEMADLASLIDSTRKQASNQRDREYWNEL